MPPPDGKVVGLTPKLALTGSPMVRLPGPLAAGSGWAEVSVTVTVMA